MRSAAKIPKRDFELYTVPTWDSSGWVARVPKFDGSFQIDRLPVNRSYNIYVEPLVGLALPSGFSFAFAGLCSASIAPTCVTPSVNTNFNIRVAPASP